MKTFGKNGLILLAILCFACVQIFVGDSFAASAGETNAHKIGNIKIYTLLDAVHDVPEGWLLDSNRPQHDAVVKTGKTMGYLQCFVITIGGKNILFDTGLGETGFPGASTGGGSLKKALLSIGLTVDDIDAVIISHFHSDHTGGLLGNEKPVFPHAEILISEAEINAYNTAHELRFLAAYGSKVRAFAHGVEIFPGILAIAAPGHTSGNTVFKIQDGNDKLLMISDVIHFTRFQFANPNLTVIFDEDQKMAITTRKQILDLAVKENIPLAGPHIDFPGIVSIQKSADGYSFHLAK